MRTLGQPIHGPLPGRRGRLAPWWPVLDGVVAGAIAGLATIVATYLAPWWVVQIVGFLASPVLLATAIFEPATETAASAAIVGGSVLLYVAYGEFLAFCVRREITRSLWIVVILLAHTICLIAWIGTFIREVIAGLPF